LPSGAFDQVGKILVVDDEKYNLDIIKAFFTILKMKDIESRVTFCNDGENALQVIKDSVDRGNP
jgi:CheY-like chemotaxis protein